MKTFEFTFTQPTSDIQHDMLTTMLGDLGFDSFMDDDMALKAYCTEDQRDDQAVEELLRMEVFHGVKLLNVEAMPEKDWNELWEASYQPVVVNERCRVRAPFHEPDPSFEFDLVIEPKMSFGTANHETTAQIITLMLETDFQGKEVLDMGSGTAVLAILAKKLGAAKTVAIDNDEWAYRNGVENAKHNHCDELKVLLGDASLLGSERYDIILANINRNILLQDIPQYVKCMNDNALLFLSGFYEEDLPALRYCCAQNGLKYLDHKSKDKWVAARFQLAVGSK